MAHYMLAFTEYLSAKSFVKGNFLKQIIIYSEPCLFFSFLKKGRIEAVQILILINFYRNFLKCPKYTISYRCQTNGCDCKKNKHSGSYQ